MPLNNNNDWIIDNLVANPVVWDDGPKDGKVKKIKEEGKIYFEELDAHAKNIILLKKFKHNIERLKIETKDGFIKCYGDDIPVKVEDAFYHAGIYYNKKGKHVTTDIITGEFVLKAHCKKVITDMKELTFGFTSCYEYLPKAQHPEFGEIITINKEILIKEGYKECIVDGVFYNDGKNGIRNRTSNIGNYIKYRNPVRHLFRYCDKSVAIKYGEESNTFLLTEGKKYTFGCELEFSELYVPGHIKLDYNMECMRDGSLNKNHPGNVGGPEIVTGVLKGDAGINHLQEICLELSPRCTINKECGVHIHIGGFTRNNEFILFAYLLGQKIQKEFLDIVPPSRRGNEYCKLMKVYPFVFPVGESPIETKMRIDKYFQEIFYYLSCGRSLGKELNTRSQHPMGPKTQYDHSTPRYCWLNLIPTAFNTREDDSYTIEFRHMQGSCNFDKIFNWIKICMAFVYFVENAQVRIMYDKKITLEDIIKFAYPKGHKNLLEYVKERKDKFSTGSEISEQIEYAEKTTTKKKIKEIICV